MRRETTYNSGEIAEIAEAQHWNQQNRALLRSQAAAPAAKLFIIPSVLWVSGTWPWPVASTPGSTPGFSFPRPQISTRISRAMKTPAPRTSFSARLSINRAGVGNHSDLLPGIDGRSAAARRNIPVLALFGHAETA
jgi:hypothetical protein